MSKDEMVSLLLKVRSNLIDYYCQDPDPSDDVTIMKLDEVIDYLKEHNPATK